MTFCYLGTHGGTIKTFGIKSLRIIIHGLYNKLRVLATCPYETDFSNSVQSISRNETFLLVNHVE